MHDRYASLQIPEHFKVKLMLYNEEPTFSFGVVELLERIRQTGSLNKSCKEMKMAYSKGLRIIRRAEQDLQYNLITGKIGGVGGGGSELTKEGIAFLDFYNDMTQQIETYAYDLIDKTLAKVKKA